MSVSKTSSLTVEEAEATMREATLGKRLQINENELPAGQNAFLNSLKGSLEEQMTQLREIVIQQHSNAVATGVEVETSQKHLDDLAEYEKATKRAASYLRDIEEELAKGESSVLRIDQRMTKKTGETYITLKSLDQWARKKHAICIIDPTESPPIVTGGPTAPPKTSIEPGMDSKPKRRGRTRQLDQEDAILAAIRELGYDPKRLPTSKPRVAGVFAKVAAALLKNELFSATTSFKKAWERLRQRGEIADMK